MLDRYDRQRERPRCTSVHPVGRPSFEQDTFDRRSRTVPRSSDGHTEAGRAPSSRRKTRNATCPDRNFWVQHHAVPPRAGEHDPIDRLVSREARFRTAFCGSSARRSVDEVDVVAQRPEEQRDLIGRVLEIVVDGEDERESSLPQSGEDGVVLSVVAKQRESPNPGEFGRQLDDRRPRAVAAPVVDEDDLDLLDEGSDVAIELEADLAKCSGRPVCGHDDEMPGRIGGLWRACTMSPVLVRSTEQARG